MTELIEVTKTGYKWILTDKGSSRYQRPNGKFCSKRSYANSARSEPGPAGKVKRIDRAEDVRPTPIPKEPGFEDVFYIEDVKKWKKDKGVGHIGIADIEVGS